MSFSQALEAVLGACKPCAMKIVQVSLQFRTTPISLTCTHAHTHTAIATAPHMRTRESLLRSFGFGTCIILWFWRLYSRWWHQPQKRPCMPRWVPSSGAWRHGLDCTAMNVLVGFKSSSICLWLGFKAYVRMLAFNFCSCNRFPKQLPGVMHNILKPVVTRE